MRAYHLEIPGTVGGIVPRESPVPEPGPRDVLVRVRAVSLNKRDLLILRGTYPLKAVPDVIPLSDGAGEVVAVGAEVTRFAVGDRVASTYFPNWTDGRITPDRFDQPGATLDGMLTEYACLGQDAVVRVPGHLTWEEAACLPCAGVTAWHSLTGGEPLVPGQTVLTLGTGALSLFVVQFAKTLGAEVIVTTSDRARADRVKALGADQVVDYVEHPEWGRVIRELTGGRGADLIVETNGPDTIEQSMRAAALYGQVVLLITGNGRRPGIEISNTAYASSLATIRRVFVGSRAHFESMNRALELHGTRPVVDRVLGFDEVGEAFRHCESGAAFGKVVIRVS
ncbi:NAD(P)-dependent alcohol dehydrogenase [Streptomyces sp. NPDC051997]|uniref:zinc-dependent alcohol dehydrogenase family protein n=1 Tax=Streptomyces sp. NPDC051997 TaxID=3155611 RepID=UPI003420686F